jgi:hypothetical protein
MAVPAQPKITMASGTGTGAHREKAKVITKTAIPPRVNTNHAHRGIQRRRSIRMGDV